MCALPSVDQKLGVPGINFLATSQARQRVARISVQKGPYKFKNNTTVFYKREGATTVHMSTISVFLIKTKSLTFIGELDTTSRFQTYLSGKLREDENLRSFPVPGTVSFALE